MGLTPGDIQALLDLFEASSWQEMTIDIGEDHLHVSRADVSAPAPAPARVPAAVDSSAPAAAPRAHTASSNGETGTAPRPAPAVTPPAPEVRAAGVAVEAPSVGLFWRSPAPGAPPFVDVGSWVGPDDTLAIIEVMKLMSPLKAGRSGVVTAVLVENGATVARGEPLVLIDPGP